MSKTKVLVFTQIGKWNNLDDEILQRVKPTSWNDQYPNENKTIVKCGFAESAFLEPIDLYKLSNEEGVFLVYDSINEKSFKDLEQQCSGHEVFVLTHSTGTCQQNSFSIWQKKPFVLSGMHSNSEEDSYYPLFDILTDDKEDKMKRIIDTIFMPHDKQEVVLQFLYGCLVPNNVDDSFVSARKKLLADHEMKDAVEDFIEATNTHQQRNDIDYQEALSQLRDMLLDYAFSKE